MEQYYQNIIGLIAVAAGIISVIAVVIALAFTKGEKSVQNAHYYIDEEWTFGPLLISAVEEPNVGPDYPELISDPQQLIGGSAHGKW